SRRHRSPWHHRTARWRVSSPSSRWWFSTDSLLRLPRARLSVEVRRALVRRWTESLPMGNAEGPLPDAGEVPVKRSPEMTTLLKIALSAAVVAALSIAQASDAGAQAAQSYEAPPKEANAIFANYRFRNGETLPELRLNYTTLGQPRRNSHGAIDNAVLMLHWTSASGQALLTPEFRTALFAPGAPFDVTRYFVILPDAIGHGRSSKPSDGLRAAFPRYGYGDMVDLQHRLVTEVLGIARLRAIAGISMGCMNAWQWAEAYPDAMDGIMRLMIDGVPHLQETVATPEKADAFLRNMREQAVQSDANDLIYALQASGDFDTKPGSSRVKAKVLAVNFADDEFYRDSLQTLQRDTRVIPGARVVVRGISEGSAGHLTMTRPALWADQAR